jgi:hypothetical protein
MVYKEGWEQIPQNWYPRSIGYSLVDLNLDVVEMVLKYPQLVNIGGNTGTVNSFAGVDLTNVLGGVITVGQLLESNNLFCFALEVVKLASPNYLNNLYSTISVPLNLLLDIISVPLLILACPTWDDLTYNGKPLWKALEADFAGANRTLASL